jgi:UPF0755 protein
LGGLAAVVVAVTGTVAARWWITAVDQPGPLPEPRAIVVPHGGIAQLAETLTADGLISRPWVFRAARLLTPGEGPLRAAEFAFPAHASVREVLMILRTAHPVEHHVTIAEGLTAQQIQAVIEHADATQGPTPAIPEGSLLPQTYDYEYGTERARIVERAKAAMDRDLAAAWIDRAPSLSLSSPRDALILASIVERETARPDERPHVAAVYLNRLRLGMKLQADPTVAYAASRGTGVLDHPLTRAELNRDTPFNTYRSPGLPPAPICSPGLDSLRAVMHPANSDDLFFVADGSGGHVFSRSYEAHDSAVARWRALGQLPSRGGAE